MLPPIHPIHTPLQLRITIIGPCPLARQPVPQVRIPQARRVGRGGPGPGPGGDGEDEDEEMADAGEGGSEEEGADESSDAGDDSDEEGGGGRDADGDEEMEEAGKGRGKGRRQQGGKGGGKGKGGKQGAKGKGKGKKDKEEEEEKGGKARRKKAAGGSGGRPVSYIDLDELVAGVGPAGGEADGTQAGGTQAGGSEALCAAMVGLLERLDTSRLTKWVGAVGGVGECTGQNQRGSFVDRIRQKACPEPRIGYNSAFGTGGGFPYPWRHSCHPCRQQLAAETARERERAQSELVGRVEALAAELGRSAPNMRAGEQYAAIKEREREQVGGGQGTEGCQGWYGAVP